MRVNAPLTMTMRPDTSVTSTPWVLSSMMLTRPRANIVAFDICYTNTATGQGLCPNVSAVAAIDQAIADGVGVMVSPIAFVSEHVETLVELDIEYAQLAQKLALPFYLRAPTPGVAPRFIDALATLAERALAAPGKVQSETGGRLCPAVWGLCPNRA